MGPEIPQRIAWRATVQGVAKIGHNLANEEQQQQNITERPGRDVVRSPLGLTFVLGLSWGGGGAVPSLGCSHFTTIRSSQVL